MKHISPTHILDKAQGSRDLLLANYFVVVERQRNTVTPTLGDIIIHTNTFGKYNMFAGFAFINQNS